MARSEARLQFGMWRAGLDGLSPHAKLYYVVLLTESTLNHAGVGVIRHSWWARNASLTEDEARKAMAELVDGNYVILDEETEEVFVRTLIRNDGVAEQPYVLKGALREALAVDSAKIRIALAAELRKLPTKRPDGVSRSGGRVTYPDPHATADVLDPPPTPRPSRKTPETLSEGSTKESQDSPESPLGGGGGGGSSSVGTSSSSVAARTRGTRIPENFVVTTEMVEWARVNVPGVDGKRETEKFIDHWRAKTGRDATKADWVGTWRNWMRKAEEIAAPKLRIVNGRPVQVAVFHDSKTGRAVER